METDKASDNLEGLVLPGSSQESGNNSSTQSGSASQEVIRQRKTRSDAGKPRGPRGANNVGSVPPVSNPLSQQQFAALYSPELWEKAVCAPADALAAITGKPHWEVSEKERKAVGSSCSIAAQCFAVTDPRWLAASLALVTILDIYGIRLAKDMQERREERKQKEAAKVAQGFKQQV